MFYTLLGMYILSKKCIMHIHLLFGDIYMNLHRIYARLFGLEGARYGKRELLLPMDPMNTSLHEGFQRAFMPTRCVRLAMRILCRLRPDDLNVLKFAKSNCMHFVGHTPAWLDKAYTQARGKSISAGKKGKPRKPFSDAHRAKLKQAAQKRITRVKELEEALARLQLQLANTSPQN
jgi:hypothetical protein